MRVSTNQREDENEYKFNICGQHFVSEVRFKGLDKKRASPQTSVQTYRQMTSFDLNRPI